MKISLSCKGVSKQRRKGKLKKRSGSCQRKECKGVSLANKDCRWRRKKECWDGINPFILCMAQVQHAHIHGPPPGHRCPRLISFASFPKGWMFSGAAACNRVFILGLCRLDAREISPLRTASGRGKWLCWHRRAVPLAQRAKPLISHPSGSFPQRRIRGVASRRACTISCFNIVIPNAYKSWGGSHSFWVSRIQ